MQLEVAMQTRVEFMDGRCRRDRDGNLAAARDAASRLGHLWSVLTQTDTRESKVFSHQSSVAHNATRETYTVLQLDEGSSPPDLHTRQHTRTPLLHTPATREDTPLKSRHKHAHSDTPYHLSLSHSAN